MGSKLRQIIAIQLFVTIPGVAGIEASQENVTSRTRGKRDESQLTMD
jgi:hypothetical protein